MKNLGDNSSPNFGDMPKLALKYASQPLIPLNWVSTRRTNAALAHTGWLCVASRRKRLFQLVRYDSYTDRTDRSKNVILQIVSEP